MTNEEKISAVTRWQTAGYVHPLTCGVNSGHENLRAVERDGRVILECPTCGYVQEDIPAVVLHATLENPLV